MTKRTLYPRKPTYLVVHWDKIVFIGMILSLLIFFAAVMGLLIYLQADITMMHTIQGG